MKIKKKGLFVGILAAVFVTGPSIAGAASNTANSTLNATVGDIISITSSATVTISIAPTSGGVVSSASDTITVNTNRTAGYNLKLADSDTVTNLVSGANTITAMGSTWGSPATLTNGKWGMASPLELPASPPAAALVQPTRQKLTMLPVQLYG